MEGVFFYILFFKVTLFKVVELPERKEENKTKQNQPTNKKQSNTQTRTLLSMNRTWLENFKKHFFSSKIDIHDVS